MHSDHGHAHDHDQHGAEGNFEPTDAHVVPILITGAFLVAVTAISFFTGYLLLNYSKARSSMTSFEPTPLSPERQEWRAGDIRLQVNLSADYLQYDNAAKPKLTTYGVISDEPEIYHFPIQIAIDYVADHGMPEFKPFGDGSLEGTMTEE